MLCQAKDLELFNLYFFEMAILKEILHEVNAEILS